MLQPLGNRVVVQRADLVEESEGGILLNTEGVDKPDRGEVIAVGTGRILDNGDVIEMVVAVGDIVVFGARIGIELTVDDLELVVLFEEEVIGIIK